MFLTSCSHRVSAPQFKGCWFENFWNIIHLLVWSVQLTNPAVARTHSPAIDISSSRERLKLAVELSWVLLTEATSDFLFLFSQQRTGNSLAQQTAKPMNQPLPGQLRHSLNNHIHLTGLWPTKGTKTAMAHMHSFPTHPTPVLATSYNMKCSTSTNILHLASYLFDNLF